MIVTEAGGSAMDRDEYQALRAEIIVRIQLQNVILMLLMPLFGCAGIAMAIVAERAAVIALVYIVTSGIGGLLWIHHAARTTQIKHYLRMVLEPRLRNSGSWEHWHAINRVAGVLGSRWRLSTFGVFIGSDIMVLALAKLTDSSGHADRFLIISLAGVCVSAVLLLPPKMSGRIRAQLAETASKLDSH